jgi:hypothetical protein
MGYPNPTPNSQKKKVNFLWIHRNIETNETSITKKFLKCIFFLKKKSARIPILEMMICCDVGILNRSTFSTRSNLEYNHSIQKHHVFVTQKLNGDINVEDRASRSMKA